MIKLIAVEGLDCVGKSTFCNLLKDYILEHVKEEYEDNVNVIVQHFPYYECKTGEKIKKILQNETEVNRKELMNMFIDNMREWKEDFYNKISDNLDKLTIIICDRYLLSTHLYYLPYVKYKIKNMFEIRRMQRGYGLTKPSITFILEINPAIQFDRLREKTDKHKLFETEETQKLLQDNFYPIIKEYSSVEHSFMIHIDTEMMIEERNRLMFEYLGDEVLSNMKKFPLWYAMLYVQELHKKAFNYANKADDIMRMIMIYHKFKVRSNAFIHE